MGRAAQAPRRGVVLAAVIALLFPAIAAPIAGASSVIGVNTISQEVNGDGFCSLQEAIYAANLDDNLAPDIDHPGEFIATACVGGDGTDTIELPAGGVFTITDPMTDAANYIGPSATPIITSAIIIEGRGARLQRHPLGRPSRAFVVGTTGDLDLREVHVTGFEIEGGDGNDGGGGGMGAGGAIYVHGGDLRIQWSTFTGNRATGGNGRFHDQIAGGGGGGLSGDGGAGANSDTYEGGGGGGGSRGDGAAVDLELVNDYDHYWGGGGGGRVTSAVSEVAGEPCGGLGGQSLSFPPDGAEDGGDGRCFGGGGGGGTNREFIVDPYCGGDGGAGSYGGGGGGGGQQGDGGHGGFGGGGGGNGGDGGFGGGGGSEEGCTVTGAIGAGGTFAGDGGRHAGGGGAGLGGAVFGHEATITISNSTFTGNTAERGQAGGEGANDGRGAGGAVFAVGGDLTIESSTIVENSAITVTNGGGGGVVVYDPEGSVEATLVLRNSIVAWNGAAECYTRNGVTTSGSAGNLIIDSTENNLGNEPCPGVASALDPELGPLQLNGGRTPNMAISATSPARDAALGTSPLDDQRGIARPQGDASDIGAYELSLIPPTTTIMLTPASPNGSNGWYTSAVGVSVSATDPDGSVAQTRCVLDAASVPGSLADLPDAACAITSVSADGGHVIHAASVDGEGNAEASVVSASFKIDATAPTLAPSLSSTVVTVGQAGVTATANATDDTSGVASQGCGVVDTATPGSKTVTCTATDNAGITTSLELAYVVEYRILGFFSPVPESKWKVGQRVPIKIALGDLAGTRIPDADGLALAGACRVTFEATGAQTVSGKCLKYDPVTDQFLYTWKLGRNGAGNATIAVVISYPGSTVTTRLSVAIVITR